MCHGLRGIAYQQIVGIGFWAHLEAREPFRDRQKDDELQNALRKLVFDSAGSDKINFDTLCDASMPDTWMVFTSGEPHRSPKVSF